MSVEEFWNGFSVYKDLLMDIDSAEKAEADALLERLDGDLKAYCEGLDFVLGDLTAKGRTLTLTAGGDTDYFEPLIALCENAPVLDFWDIIAFKPAKGTNVSISFENYRLSSKNLWFIPLESEEETEQVGLRIALKEFKEEDEDLLIAVYSLLEEMLGEYYTATLLGYFELCALPQQPSSEGFSPLTDLPEYLDYFLNSIEQE